MLNKRVEVVLVMMCVILLKKRVEVVYGRICVEVRVSDVCWSGNGTVSFSFGLG